MKRRRRKRNIRGNALLVARTLGERYHRSGEENQQKYGLAPPVAPSMGYEYTDDMIDITTTDHITGSAVHVKSSELGHWQPVFAGYPDSINRFNDGDWVEHLAELADDIRSKARRAEQARHEPLKNHDLKKTIVTLRIWRK